VSDRNDYCFHTIPASAINPIPPHHDAKRAACEDSPKQHTRSRKDDRALITTKGLGRSLLKAGTHEDTNIKEYRQSQKAPTRRSSESCWSWCSPAKRRFDPDGKSIPSIAACKRDHLIVNQHIRAHSPRSDDAALVTRVMVANCAGALARRSRISRSAPVPKVGTRAGIAALPGCVPRWEAQRVYRPIRLHHRGGNPPR